MRIFYFPTAIVTGLLLSYISTLLCHKKINVYENDLLPAQQPLYDDIVYRRLYYFVIGVVLGLFLCILYLVLPGLGRSTTLYHRVVHCLLIFLLTPMIVYSLLPKPVYMLETSTTPQETQAWFRVYVCMKNAMIYGFCIGFLAALVIMGVIEALWWWRPSR